MSKINWSPFSEKAILSMLECDAFINIWSGAVRSGKTVVSILAWLDFVRKSPHTDFMMSGESVDSLYRNVIDGDVGIINILGAKKAKFITAAKGGARLILKFSKTNVKTLWCRGGGNVASEKSIRGMTIGGWYADEITLHHETFVKQALNRMSLDGARAFWTTNPDSPFHPIYTDFILRAGTINEKTGDKYDYKYWDFTLDDNISLSDRYKKNIKSAYEGVWFQRMILGLWVIAEGLIYPMFAKDHIVTMADTSDIKFVKYWVGIDYGNTNATVFLLFGLTDNGILYLLEEYYHSGGEEGQGKAPSIYARDFVTWLTRVSKRWPRMRISNIIIDPSAKGFKLELKAQNVRNIKSANNAVTLGIGKVMNLIASGRFRVLNHCKYTIKELQTYAWDAKASLRGEDKPLKDNDHCMDAFRYVVLTCRRFLKI